MSVEHFPFNYDELQKGMSISAERLEQIVGVPRIHKDYAFKVLAVKERIERELRDRNRVVTVAIIRDCLELLTDEAAAEYNQQQAKIAIRKLGRAHFRNGHVDVTQLTQEQREQHERNLLINGQILTAIRSIRRKLLPKPHERQTPGLLEAAE